MEACKFMSVLRLLCSRFICTGQVFLKVSMT
jgi:hypothetical protein